MVSGKPLSQEQKTEIIANKDTLFPSQIAEQIGCEKRAVARVIKEYQKSL